LLRWRFCARQHNGEDYEGDSESRRAHCNSRYAPAPQHDPFFNVNRPEELAEAERRLADAAARRGGQPRM
jgi:hypothetical protein